jgi:adenylate kinase
MRVVFIGPPGCGKGTQAQLLRERLGLAYIGTGEMLRAEIRHGTQLGRQVKSYLDAGRLAPDDLVNAVIAECFHQADRPSKFVLDGYPRTVTQAQAVDKILNGLSLPLQAVIYFQIDDEEVVQRMLKRKRPDDTEETVRNRLRIFHETMPDLLRHYRRLGLLREVPAKDAIETVYDRIVQLL